MESIDFLLGECLDPANRCIFPWRSSLFDGGRSVPTKRGPADQGCREPDFARQTPLDPLATPVVDPL